MDGQNVVCCEVAAQYNTWQEATAQEAIETEVICRNWRHLEQTAREGGVTQAEFMQKVQEDYGLKSCLWLL